MDPVSAAATRILLFLYFPTWFALAKEWSALYSDSGILPLRELVKEWKQQKRSALSWFCLWAATGGYPFIAVSAVALSSFVAIAALLTNSVSLTSALLLNWFVLRSFICLPQPWLSNAWFRVLQEAVAWHFVSCLFLESVPSAQAEMFAWMSLRLMLVLWLPLLSIHLIPSTGSWPGKIRAWRQRLALSKCLRVYPPHAGCSFRVCILRGQDPSLAFAAVHIRGLAVRTTAPVLGAFVLPCGETLFLLRDEQLDAFYQSGR